LGNTIDYGLEIEATEAAIFVLFLCDLCNSIARDVVGVSWAFLFFFDLSSTVIYLFVDYSVLERTVGLFKVQHTLAMRDIEW